MPLSLSGHAKDADRRNQSHHETSFIDPRASQPEWMQAGPPGPLGLFNPWHKERKRRLKPVADQYRQQRWNIYKEEKQQKLAMAKELERYAHTMYVQYGVENREHYAAKQTNPIARERWEQKARQAREFAGKKIAEFKRDQEKQFHEAQQAKKFQLRQQIRQQRRSVSEQMRSEWEQTQA